MLPKEDLQKLKDIFAGYSKIKVVYLFGSYATNKENQLSDLDLGILLDDNYGKQIKLDILKELVSYGFSDVDLVILNESPPLLQFEIVKHNQVIYKKEEFDHAAYFSKTIRKFLDFRPFLEVQREYFKERLTDG